MKEVVSVHVGQSGVQVSDALWSIYCLDHGVEADGVLTDRSEANYRGFSSFFMETETGSYTPIALLVDLEPTVVDEVRKGRLGNLYNPSQLLNWNEDAANNFARGYASIGGKVVDQVADALCRISENCEALQGFMFFHSVGGGTGSGLVPLLVERVSELFQKKEKLLCSVYPSPKLSSAVVEPYNAVLSTHASLAHSDLTFISDNEVLYRISQKNLELDCPTYRTINRIVAQGYGFATANLRFDGLVNADLDELKTNLVPYPRLQFPMLSFAPILSERKFEKSINSVGELTRACFGPYNRTVDCNTRSGKYLACSLLFRGDVALQAINKAVIQAREGKWAQFAPWSPAAGFKVGINLQPPRAVGGAGPAGHASRAVCLMANHTGIGRALARIRLKFDLMLAKKAFLHWYLEEGLEESFFFEARRDLLALEREYEEMSKRRPENGTSNP